MSERASRAIESLRCRVQQSGRVSGGEWFLSDRQWHSLVLAGGSCFWGLRHPPDGQSRNGTSPHATSFGPRLSGSPAQHRRSAAEALSFPA